MADPIYALAKHFKQVKVTPIGCSEGPDAFIKMLARELEQIRKVNGS